MSEKDTKDDIKQTATDAENAQPIFNIEKLYVKGVSLEQPHSPEIFLNQEQPEVEMKIGLSNKELESGFYDCSITATVTTTLEDKRVVYLAEVIQSGIFRIENIEATDIDAILHITCPNILFPYAREVISDLITRAGYPPIYMTPINFEAMYQQQLEQTANA